MGNCLTCFKVPPAQSEQGAPLPAEHGLLEKKSDEMAGLLQTTLPDRHIVQHELTNGNTKQNSNIAQSAPLIATIVGSDNCGSLPREKSNKNFYHRIPSLPKSVTTMGSDQSRVSESKLSALFEVYKDPQEDMILAEGIEHLCNDLQVAPDDFRVLVFAWKLNAEQMCRFTRQEFIQGLRSLKTDTIKAIQNRLPELVTEVEGNPEQFKSLYRFTFRFGLDVANGQRILPSDMAIVLWKLVFTVCEPPILKRWLSYLEKHPNVRGIPKDTWNMFLNFSDTVGSDLSSYDDTEAWPSLFDDFVEFENDHMNQNISKSDVIKDGSDC